MCMYFQNYRLLSSDSLFIWHSVEVVSNEPINVDNAQVVEDIAELASIKFGYHYLGYGLYRSRMINHGNGIYTLEFKTGASCE